MKRFNAAFTTNPSPREAGRGWPQAGRGVRCKAITITIQWELTLKYSGSRRHCGDEFLSRVCQPAPYHPRASIQ
jgi:hypothetical protein